MKGKITDISTQVDLLAGFQISFDNSEIIISDFLVPYEDKFVKYHGDYYQLVESNKLKRIMKGEWKNTYLAGSTRFEI